LEVTLDCSQNVFHTTKAASLHQMIVTHQEKHSVSFIDMPILRELYNRPGGNDTIVTMAEALDIVISDENRIPIIANKPTTPEGNENKYSDFSNAYSYRQYRSAANRLASTYLDESNDYYDLKQVIVGKIEHADVVLPLVKLDLLPFPRNYLSKTKFPRDTKHKCYLDLKSFKVRNNLFLYFITDFLFVVFILCSLQYPVLAASRVFFTPLLLFIS